MFPGSLASPFTLGPASEIVNDVACGMCQVFQQTFRRRPGAVEYYIHPFHMRSIYAHKVEGMLDTVSIAIVQNPFAGSTVSDHPWVIQDIAQKSGWISPVPESCLPNNVVPQQLQPMADFEVIRGWLNLCSAIHHETCYPVLGRTMFKIRLIDCLSRTLVCRPDYFDRSYVALSYVWGLTATDQPTAHPAANESKLVGPLPKVIEDAIIATQKLGFRYLWVDR